ncbi:contactin-like [Crassostrea virginica]|uniref:Contactin-like n=1 Tax=Crassostrea virginica TaxID=6565 RepID=A0A8B8C6F7_CRAVI|nr:contactin-like [Crassostrea virginica]XP_022311300.1 contactin-like [Crassostrea virginica]
MFFKHVVSIIFLAVLEITPAQRILDCPVGWFTYNDHCYKFQIYPKRTYEEAVKTCEGFGAALVSVNSVDENNFITQRLLEIDHWRSLWYTSGIHQDGVVRWNGDGSQSSSNILFWISAAHRDLNPMIIVYSYAENLLRYGWSKVEGDDLYNFICEIKKSELNRIVQQERDFTYGSNITDPLKVEKGPRFSLQPKNVVLTTRSYLPSIECVAIGNPQPTYLWQRKGYTGQVDTLVSNTAYTISNGKLTFDNTRLNETRDTGEYYCVSSNRFGSVRSEPSKVSFGRLEQFPNVAPGPVNVALYQGTYLQCNPPSHKPALKYQWMKGSSFLLSVLNKHFFVSAGGNLYFSEVQTSDDANYHCVVTLAALPGDSMATSQPPTETSLSMALNVIGESAANYPPQIHTDFPAVFPRTPLKGMDVRLECLAYGRLPLDYSWVRKGNKDLPRKAYTKDYNRVLVIPDIQFGDEGTYSCLVRGRINADDKDVFLSIDAKPYFLYPLRDLVVDENSQVTLRCEALGRPKPTFSWYKNSELILPVPGEIDIVSNVLTIARAQVKKHSGMYECAAQNTHGTSITTAQIKVISLKPTFAKYPLPNTMLAAENGNLTIPCRPEAAPSPEIVWMKNGGQLALTYTNGNQGGAQMLLNGYLKIVGVSQGDSGFYTCQAKNVHGSDQTTTNVVVSKGVYLAPIPRTFTVDRNGSLFIQCQASYDASNLDLVYVWKFNGQLIDLDRETLLKKGTSGGFNGLFINYADYHHAGQYECIAQTTITQTSVATEVKVRGPPGMPGLVYRVKGSETPHSVTLKWTRAPDHDSSVLFYHIEAQTVFNSTWRLLSRVTAMETLIPGPNPDDKRQYTVSGLIPYNNYRFRVYATNAYLEPGEMSLPTEEIHIPGARPIMAPTNVGGGGGSVGVLTITWRLLSKEYESGPNVVYHVYWRRSREGPINSEFQMQNLTVSDKRLVISNRTDGLYGTYTETLPSDDLYYLPYDVMVGVGNAYGSGPNSTIVTIYSSEGIPLARPQNVNGFELNSTALWVTWDPMLNTRENAKGVIKGYRITVHIELVDDDTNEITFKKVVTSYYHGQMSANKVIGMEPNTDYWVTVEMFNSAGLSNPSERQRLSTCLAAPILYPEFVNIQSHGSNSVYVEWRGVSTGLFEETLWGYKMRYWLQGDDIRTANDTITGKETHGVIYGIQRGYVYCLRVMGFSKGGDGKMSPTTYFTLGGLVPVDRTISEIRAAGSAAQSSLAIVCLSIVYHCMFHYVNL